MKSNYLDEYEITARKGRSLVIDANGQCLDKDVLAAIEFISENNLKEVSLTSGVTVSVLHSRSSYSKDDCFGKLANGLRKNAARLGQRIKTPVFSATQDG